MLGIVSGSLGLLSIFLPWVAIPGFGINLIQVLDLTNELGRLGFAPDPVQVGEFSVTAVALLAACLILLVVGSVVSFVRRGGGVLILIAWIGFVVGFYVFLPAIVRLIVGFGAGFYLAVVASIISLSRYALKPFLRPALPPAYPGVPVAWYQYPPPPP